MDDDGVLDDADADEGLAEEVDEALVEDADDDALGPRGVRQGAEEVEGRPHAERLSHGRDEAHRRVVLRRLGRKRVIRRRFNVDVPRARIPERTSTLRNRSER